MRNYAKKRILIIAVALLVLVSGCADNEEINIESPEIPQIQSMEEEARIEYDIPKSNPHILVDQLGYPVNETKQALFFGNELPENFKVISKADNQIAYVGTLEKCGYSDEYGCNVSVGDFTELISEGEYYIQSELLGTSYDFSIAPDIYDGIFHEACKNYFYNRCGVTLTENLAGSKAHNACHTGSSILREDVTSSLDVSGGWHQDANGSKNVEMAAYALANILLSYEIFPSVYTDDFEIPESGNGIPDILDEAKYEIDWLLKMQKPTGDVYSALTIPEGDNKSSVSYVEASTLEATAAFAFSLAKFSYLYKEYDKEYATYCLKAADKAIKYINKNNKDKKIIDWNTAANFEIYRASGSKECKKYIDEYLANSEIEEINDIAYYGCITYLNTKMPVDVKHCEKLMKIIMKQAESISEKSRDASFLVPFGIDQQDNSVLLDSMVQMSIVDYIIANHEYDNIMENYLHYFLGRNPECIVYIDDIGSNNYIDNPDSVGIMKQFIDNSKLILMMSKISSIDIHK